MFQSSNWRVEGGSEVLPVDKDSRVAKSIASYKEVLDKDITSLKRSEATLKCYEESIQSYRNGSFEEAMESFCQYLALVESQQIVDPEMRATLYSNIAVCLHQLSEWDLAKLYYDTALAIFGTATTATAAWLYYGDIKRKKVDHICGQLELLKDQKKPLTNTRYIDSNGQRRAFSDTDTDSPDSSYFSLSSWIAWYYVKQGWDQSAAAPVPAAPAP